MTSDRQFPTSERLKRSSDFDVAIRTGSFFRHRLVTVVVSSGGAAHRRLGVSVGKRVGGAVRRNRLKRRLRALYAAHRDLLPEGCDCVIIAKPEAAGAKAGSLGGVVRNAFAQAGRSPRGRQALPGRGAAR
ncbi:MAG: ribonuclease P protein component [Armatimonadetes bacterium CG_4_10_14_3_um_filter_66_18]|nr:ribonuclease P protein component [Armatimonadota bacterium]PIU94223.1 MAG: ribonuclease P protein component [Armatimonadetes bacterium CG06_land_8_20_14_3_00_66_21]PIW20024.1 MAG: ribonuclease P protein component [Armatimonadetes bacterium CG17_big_fil_post_rev_8_21_14_2_50_66_6]PIX40533.1 MAG: ribonuclease P protein component [Armatimonadetes bacterium CG_4_8_14_3_um_filter_66_20]PIY36683.1 MAG: ribonuclease P protein component [Armatimonadetes bacterium CG_4_10_14_3_um_filter_66_18]PIZ482